LAVAGGRFSRGDDSVVRACVCGSTGAASQRGREAVTDLDLLLPRSALLPSPLSSLPLPRRPHRLRLHASQFDFIDVGQFYSKTFGSRLSYAWYWTLFLISIAVYVADTYTLIALLASNRWSGQILQSEAAQADTKSSNVLEVPFKVRPPPFPSLSSASPRISG